MDSTSMSNTLENAAAAVLAHYGEMPPGYSLALVRTTSGQLVCLGCTECSYIVGRWLVPFADATEFMAQLIPTIGHHVHWQGWAQLRGMGAARTAVTPAAPALSEADCATLCAEAARSDIIRALTRCDEIVWGETGTEPITRANALLDALAHGLAEKQRAWMSARAAEELAEFGGLDHETEIQIEAVNAAADLIDPEAAA